MKRDFYTYAYLNEDGRPYYIGKGTGNRAYSSHRSVDVPSSDRILILKKDLLEEEAVRHEEYMIHVLGRKVEGDGILDNKFRRGWAGSIYYKRESPDEWAHPILRSLFGSKTAACILLFINEKEEAHALRISKVFGFGLNMVQRQLKKLEESCVLCSRKIGMIRVYQFNRCNPIVKELRLFLSACSSMPR